MRYLGETLALVTAVGWATSSIMFEKGSKRATGLSANLLKLVFLLIILMGITTVTRGMILPFDATPKMKILLSLSGIIGLFIGDFFLFRAYTAIGARTCSLFSTLGPIVVTILGLIFLGEKLVIMQVIAIIVVCSGIIIVVSKHGDEEGAKKINTKGVIYILVAVFMDAVGIILTKLGSDGYNSFSSSQIRAIPALLGFILLVTYKKRWSHVLDAVRDFKSVKYIFFGTLFATVGICALVEAMKHGKIGIVSTLASTSPILIIPISVFFMKEKVKKIELIGAVISCIGVSLLFI